ncbi:MAG: mannose-1-phosphate guanylyltransferase [Gemmatimonadota bacterium]
MRPHVVILAGGVGSRFWPASTPARPKQLLPLGGDSPLISDALARACELAGRDKVRILAGERLADLFRQVEPWLTDDHFFLEPRAAGTGPVLAWAAYRLWLEDPEAIMVSLHADHVISPLEEFRKSLERAVQAAETRNALVCVGVHPERPDTGYGYIRLGEETDPGVRKVRRFEEKPDRMRAATYVASGEYVWNSGIFAWRAADFLAAVRELTPEINQAFPHLERGDHAAFFDHVSPISVDVGVLERADNVEVVEATFAWDDVGTWGAVSRTKPADSDGNHVVGSVRLREASDNIVWSEDGRVVLFDVEGLVVVHSGDQTLVTSRGGAERLKEMLDQLENGADV